MIVDIIIALMSGLGCYWLGRRIGFKEGYAVGEADGTMNGIQSGTRLVNERRNRKGW